MTTRHLLLCFLLAACSDQERPAATASPSTQAGGGAGQAAVVPSSGHGQGGEKATAGSTGLVGRAGSGGEVGASGEGGHGGLGGSAAGAAQAGQGGEGGDAGSAAHAGSIASAGSAGSAGEGGKAASGGSAGKSGSAGEGGVGGVAGSGGVGASAGNGGNAGQAGRAPFTACPTDLPGPVMVQVPVPGGQTDYCIDTTEVTQAQYAAFLAAKGDDVSGQREECGWNKTFSPPMLPPGQEVFGECEMPGTYDPEHRGNYPMACVDFCDAAAYCQWAGKRLCGKIGGGSVAKADGNDAAKSQWYNVCSGGGKTKFPYGAAEEEGKCNVVREHEPSQTATSLLRPVDAATECKGQSPPFAQVRDMVGNVSEWEDRCYVPEGGTYTICAVRGSGVFPPGTTAPVSCADGGYVALFDINMIGFRCCLD